jgi:hypothetical protein
MSELAVPSDGVVGTCGRYDSSLCGRAWRRCAPAAPAPRSAHPSSGAEQCRGLPFEGAVESPSTDCVHHSSRCCGFRSVRYRPAACGYGGAVRHRLSASPGLGTSAPKPHRRPSLRRSPRSSVFAAGSGEQIAAHQLKDPGRSASTTPTTTTLGPPPRRPGAAGETPRGDHVPGPRPGCRSLTPSRVRSLGGDLRRSVAGYVRRGTGAGSRASAPQIRVLRGPVQSALCASRELLGPPAARTGWVSGISSAVGHVARRTSAPKTGHRDDRSPHFEH